MLHWVKFFFNEEKTLHLSLMLQCQWCPLLQRCSDGVDRERQLWLKHNCDSNNIVEVAKCGSDGDRPNMGDSDDNKRDEEVQSPLS